MESAEKYLGEYSTTSGIAGQVLNAQNYGLRGDIAVDKKAYDEAISLYKKAVAASDSDYTSSLYTFKQILVYAAQGETAKAEECYNTLRSNNPTAFELLRRAEEAIGTAAK